MNELTYLFGGLVIGAVVAWALAYYRILASSSQTYLKEIEQKYVSKDVHSSLQSSHDNLKREIDNKTQAFLEVNKELSSQEQINAHLEEKLSIQKQELEELQVRLNTAFENLANRILEEKSKKFTDQNQIQMEQLLNPLRDRIKEFQTGIEQRFIEETKERSSLRAEIDNLHRLNLQISLDANNLVNALKGDSKTQGDWGEFRLEMLLEKSGLTKDIHFLMQPSYKDENGQQKRPDFIIRLPENKHLVIDSKISLVAYERFFNSLEEEPKKLFLKKHVESLRSHIKDLSSKNYQSLYQINSPDYLLLFVPIEPALNAALMEDNQLFIDALDRNIVLVTTSTLLATMRTVSYIWKQEKQRNNVIEIARQSGMLYDKFVSFVEDLKAIGSRLDSAQNAFNDAMNKLTDAKRPGDTLIGRAEKIRELGAKSSKILPKELTEAIEED